MNSLKAETLPFSFSAPPHMPISADGIASYSLPRSISLPLCLTVHAQPFLLQRQWFPPLRVISMPIVSPDTCLHHQVQSHCHLFPEHSSGLLRGSSGFHHRSLTLNPFYSLKEFSNLSSALPRLKPFNSFSVHVEQGSANYSLRIESSQPPVFLNKLLLEKSYVHLFMY